MLPNKERTKPPTKQPRGTKLRRVAPASAAALEPRSPRRAAPVVEIVASEVLSPDDSPQGDGWLEHIQLVAYFIAEQEGFPPGRELDHWLEAEAKVKAAKKKARKRHLAGKTKQR